MRKIELKTRILSMVLCGFMISTSIPTTVFGAEIQGEGTTLEESNSDIEVLDTEEEILSADIKTEEMETEIEEAEEVEIEEIEAEEVVAVEENEIADTTESEISLFSEEAIESPSLGIMVNNSWMADHSTSVKAELGTDNILRIDSYGERVNYLWLSVEEGTEITYTLLQGSTSNFPSTYLNPCSNNNTFGDTSYQYYINTNYTMPLVAKFDLKNGEKEKTYYLIADDEALGSYAVEAIGFTADGTYSNLYGNKEIQFTESGQSVTLTPTTNTIGSGEAKNAKWKWSTSDITVALVDDNGKVTNVGGGEAIITAKCDQLKVECKVVSTAEKHITHTYGENKKCTVCGTRRPNDTSVKFSLVDEKGAFATANDQVTELYQAALTVSDVDCDGSLTYYDLSYAAHQTYYADVENSFAVTTSDTGKEINKFWGISDCKIGYYSNHKLVDGLMTKISGNGNVVAFFYRDKVASSDIYTYFTNASTKTVTDTEKELTVKYAGETVPVGATVTVSASDGTTAMTTKVGDDGTFQLNLKEVGTYSILVHGTTTAGTPVLPSRMSIEVFAPVSATLYMTVVNDDGNFAKGKSGSDMYRFPIEVFDNPDNPDGKVTIYEALVQLHEKECPTGASGFKDNNGFITYLWGYNTGGWLGYYFNDVYLQGYGATKTGTNGREFTDRLLATEIVDGVDYYTVYAYQTYRDSYTYFKSVEETATVGSAKTFTLYGNSTYGVATPPKGAVIKVSDSTGKEVEELGTVVGEDGTFSITFPAVGKYTIDVKNSATQAFVPSRCVVSVTGLAQDDNTGDMDKDDTITDDSTKDDIDKDDTITDDSAKDDMDKDDTPVETPDDKEDAVKHDYHISYQGSVAYTGGAITPSVTVKDGSRVLAEGVDYSVSYKNNVNVGIAQFTIRGKGGHELEVTKTFVIHACSLSDASIQVSDIYSEKTVKNPVPVITRDGKKLSNGKDFTLAYENGGVYSKSGKIIVTGKGNYTGSISVAVTVVDVKTTNLMSKVSVSNVKNFTYGEAYEQHPTVKFGKVILEKGKDYEISYENIEQAGTATMVLTGKGDYVGEKRVNFKITGTSIRKAKVSGLDKVVNYTGSEIKANYTLTLNGTTLKEGTDYTVSYGKNVSAGKASITFTGMGAYTDSVKKSFTIGKCSLETANVSLATNVAYTKGGAKPRVTLTVDGMTLREKSDYTVSYKNNAKVGATATVTITGKGSFTGKLVKTFTVGKQNLSNVKISVDDLYVKNGKIKKFQSKVVLTDVDGKKLSAGKDYDKNIIYKDANGNVLKNSKGLKVGDTITVTVTGKGAYEGSATTTYKILNK